MKNYDVPSAGSDGNYGAPTPHAASAAHEPFTAPEGDLEAMAHSGWPMTEGSHTWTRTPGESAEPPEIHPGDWTEIT